MNRMAHRAEYKGAIKFLCEVNLRHIHEWAQLNH